MRVNIVGKSNGVGLTRDVALLKEALEAFGHHVTTTNVDSTAAKNRRSFVRGWMARIRSSLARRRSISSGVRIHDLNIMLEHVWPECLTSAVQNVVVPNPEWFDKHDLRLVGSVDEVWAKTRNTEAVFRSLVPCVRFISFHSLDRLREGISKEGTFFHLAGKSTMKGTDRTLRIWAKHPEWPKLVVVQHGASDQIPMITAPNIVYHSGYLDDATLRVLQNSSRFHVCLSRAEGWGHYIVEAMSTEAITITVDAPPMNELIQPDRGLPIPALVSGKQRLAVLYDFDERSFERAVETALRLTNNQILQMGRNARAWYRLNAEDFRNRLASATAEVSMRIAAKNNQNARPG